MEPAFCSRCASPLVLSYVEEEERERLLCPSCGHIHYVNPLPVAGTIPVFDGGIWLLRRAIQPRYGYWTFPCGYMEIGESVEEAATRETREELGMEVEVGRLVGVYSHGRAPVVVIVYEARALTQPSGGKETLTFRRFAAEEIPWKALAFRSTTDALRDWVSAQQPQE